ncbi:PHM/PNGase F [Pseudovirgaria hyperparasitica]|uniref:PHM/PNGase F n=1 Tax=Pseudovirgaria hyperparasitica TaxID=470096 RepID=A0A6A6WBT7_9PEZI|nr:PHM/PNGase F [Pseudovirgaria hyperparasitica]KAF2759067.1 PHM/PNGase F [Pseudovirgaria hyperparasitica]
MLQFQNSVRTRYLSYSFLLYLASVSVLPNLALAQDTNLDWVSFDRSQFDGNAALDTEGNVQVFWKTGDNYSTYGVASRSEGYLALGFSETGAMTGADIAVGYRNSDGEFVLENRHATDFVTPELSDDQTNNIRLREGSQENGVTAFVFEKKNRADCLENQVDVSTDSWQWFIYAFSDENTFAQHGPGHNGKKYIKLGTGTTISVNEIRDIDGAQNFTIAQPEMTIPTQETTYCYTLHKLPEGNKNFILGERPSSSSDLLHHLVVYACYDLPDSAKSMVGEDPNCDFENFSNPCTGFVTEWAPGMTGRTFEPGFGKPFGSDSYEYVMFETHYNNPDGLDDVSATAAYTFLYNDDQVDTEIGTLTLGDYQVEGWTLEPGQPLVPHSTVCTPECTSRWPSAGITAVSVFFHMHQRGVNQHVQIIRDGVEISPLASIRSFEYGYQFSKSIAEVQLLPGDKLITICEFDTSADDTPVPGGLASRDEMCFAWVDYYPANGVIVCSQLDLGQAPDNPLNGTAALCLDAYNDSMPIYPSDQIDASFTPLEERGNACDVSGDATTDEAPSSAGPAGASPTTGSASLSKGLPVLFGAVVVAATALLVTC